MKRLVNLAQKLFVRYIANGELWRMGDMFQLSVELYDTKDKKVEPTTSKKIADSAKDAIQDIEKKKEDTKVEKQKVVEKPPEKPVKPKKAKAERGGLDGEEQCK